MIGSAGATREGGCGAADSPGSRGHDLPAGEVVDLLMPVAYSWIGSGWAAAEDEYPDCVSWEREVCGVRSLRRQGF
jgi:hypothetical protein